MHRKNRGAENTKDKVMPATPSTPLGKVEFSTPPTLTSRLFSKRWEMVWLLFSGIVVVYTLRVNVSVAAQKMRDELGWSEAQKGLILSAFYWGYAVGQIPASYVIQRYGAKWIFGFSVAIPSLLTMLVPVASRKSFGLALFIRCIIGFFESATFPAVFHFFPIWVPLKEKTFMIPAIVSGMYMGNIIGFSISGALAESTIIVAGNDIGGWPAVFYLFGGLGVAWFPYWAYMSYETPADHPSITMDELSFINQGKTHVPHSQTVPRYLHDAQQPHMNRTTSSTVSSPVPDFSSYNAAHSPMIAASNPMTDGSGRSTSSAATASKQQTQFARSISLSEGNVVLNADWEVDNRARTVSNQRYQAVSTTNPLLDEEDNDDENDDEDEDGHSTADGTPWLAFFTHPVSLTLFINSWAGGWIGFTLLSEMPSYLTDVLGFDLTSAGILCVFPYMALFFSALGFGALFQYLQNEYRWSTDRVRQVAEYVSYLGAAGGLILCSFMDNKYVAYMFMIIAQLLLGASQSGVGCAYSDVAPNYSSVLNSIGNTIGAIAGIIGPIAVAQFISNYPDPWGWRGAFLLTFVLAVIALIFWSLYQTSFPVPELNTSTVVKPKRHHRVRRSLGL